LVLYIARHVTKVPFDKGYYAEFQVQDFSEFWLNNGSFNNNTPLPVHVTTFAAFRNNKTAVLQWTASEQNSSHFEIEVALGNEELQRNKFQIVGHVASRGNGGNNIHFAMKNH
jgi:agmatine/peptidylarginine deiminase